MFRKSCTFKLYVKGMYSNTVVVFYTPLASKSYNLVATTTSGRSHSRHSLPGYPLLGLTSLALGLVSHKLASHNMSTMHSFFFSYNCNYPSPPYVTYLKITSFKYVKFISFQSHLLLSSNSISVTHLKDT